MATSQISTQTTKDYLILKIPFSLLKEKGLSFLVSDEGNGFLIWKNLQSLPKLWKEEKGKVFVKRVREENEKRLKKVLSSL